MSEVSPNVRSPSMSIAAQSLFVSENAGPWNATVTHGSVAAGHGTCAYTGPCGAGSCGTLICVLPRAQPPQYFSTSGTTCSAVTSPATISVVYSGRYQ